MPVDRPLENQMSKVILSSVCAAMILMASGAAAEMLRIGGTGSAMSIMRPIAEDFMAARPDIQVTVLPSLGTGGGIRAAAAGAVDVAVTGRPMLPDEIDLPLSEAYWAKTPLVFAVPDEGPVTGVTTEDLVDIYAGTKTFWAEGQHIRLILRPLSDVESSLVAAISPELDSALHAAHKRSGVPVAMTDPEAADMLERVPGSFCSSSLGLIGAEHRRLRALAFNGVKPSLATMIDGSYRLAREYYLVTARDPSPAARAFLAFLSSDAVRRRLAGWDVLVQ
jgi:phosphate transport system substrate-binding protein